ncbi:MAG: hypothetical protein IJC71_08150 [Clostridia bacterium]|nr:hypothetical protein [Clostridia bacterium]
MKKKPAVQEKNNGEGVLFPYTETGRQMLHGGVPLCCAETLTADSAGEEETAERIIARCAENGCAVRIFGRSGTEAEQTSLFRSIYRASAECSVIAVIPAVVLPSETEQVRSWAAAARNELKEKDIPFGRLRAGIAVETPSAAILADLLAPMVDFFVLHPSALIQSLGVAHSMKGDNPMPESVMRCMKMTCAAARREGIEVYLEK